MLKRLNELDDRMSKKIVFDIETINWIEPYATGVYDGEEFTLFEGKNCIKEFLDFFLTKRHRGMIAYAHNGGKFDFSFLLKELFRNTDYEKFSIEPLRVGSRISQIKIYRLARIKRGEHKGELRKADCWILRDSFALLGFSLEKLTNNFNVEHKKGDFEHSKINWKNWKELKKEWLPYLKDDCRGLFEVVTKFEKRILEMFNTNLAKIVTIAQLAMVVYRKNYLPLEIPNYTSIESDIRKSYFGGRTEIFKMHGENLNYYDVNSLYPFVMLEKEFPVGSPYYTKSFNLWDFGIAQIEAIAPKDLKIPVLPYRTEDKKLIFPVGKIKGWYPTPEIQKAVEKGYKVKILGGYVFEKKPLFKNYIKRLYKLKKNSKKNSVDYMTSKLLMNSLYGKFGQRRIKSQYFINPKDKIGLEPLDIFEDIPIYTKEVNSKACHILPAIASFVTSYARLELYKWFEEVEKQEKSVYYCDTDSIVTDAILPFGKELGELDLEQVIQKGIFVLPKMYAIKTKNGEFVKCKGFPSGLFKYEDFEKALKGDYSNFTYSKEMFATPFESMRRNKKVVSMIQFSRNVKTRYDKRIVLSNYNTIPRELK
jgi:DNA polymerase elongation subunit (family B)